MILIGKTLVQPWSRHQIQTNPHLYPLDFSRIGPLQLFKWLDRTYLSL